MAATPLAAGLVAASVLGAAGMALAVVSGRPGDQAPPAGAYQDGEPLPERYALTAVWQPPAAELDLYHPEGIDVGTDGLIVVAEPGAHRVSVWHQNGDPERTLGSAGSGPGQLRAPEDVAVDAERDRLYVADTGNRRVQVLHRRTGAHIATWADVGLPRGIARGADGRVFVADAAAGRVLVFDGEGNRLAVWGEAGNGTGRLDTPLGLAAGSDGTLFVADSGNQRVQWWDAEGRVGGQLDLTNAAGPGGAPRDVGVDDNGDLFVAVERGVLRFRGRTPGAYAETLPPLREVVRPGCRNPCACREYVPVVQNHEGVRRLVMHPRIGLFFTFAPSVRFHDRVVARPKRAFERVFPSLACGIGPSWRNLFDPHRIDAGADPYTAHVLDTSGLVRVFRANGSWYDGRSFFPGGPGLDIAASLAGPDSTAVLTGNQVGTTYLRCSIGCGPGTTRALEPDMLTRRDRTGERIPDFLWWNTAIAFLDRDVDPIRPHAPVPLRLAVLDTGRQRLIIRRGLEAVVRCDTGCVAATASPLQAPQLIAGAELNPPSQAFRAFRDVSYDPSGGLWVLARDGGVLRFDDRGRPRGEIALAGLRNRPAEALAVGSESGSAVIFVLTADEWVFKFDGSGRPLAAWDLDAAAGPGRYRDVTLDPGGRVLVPDGAGDRIVVFERVDDPAPQPIPDPRGAPCEVTPGKVAAPARLPLGATTGVTLVLAGDCGAAHEMLDVVLAIDASCMMTGDRLAKVREAGARFVEAMVQPRDRIAVVSFNDVAGGARLRAPLTDDKGALKSVLASFGTDCQPIRFFPDRRSDARMSDGLRAGREALFGPAGRAGAGKVLVLVSPSAFDREVVERLFGRWIADAAPPGVTEREHAMWEAWRLWEEGVRAYTVGVGEPQAGIGPPPAPTPDLQSTHPPDQGLLASMANPAGAYRMALAPGDLVAVYADLGRELSRRVLFQTLVITDRVPANMRLLPGSVRPPAQVQPDGTLKWTFTDVPLTGPPPLTYALEPLQSGRWPTNLDARAAYTDGLGYQGEAVFPVPEVEVIGPTPSATWTPEATPTDRPAATATPSETPTPSPSPTGTTSPTRAPTRARTPRPAPIFLPILYKDQCVPKPVPLDVALLIDTSSSMNGAKIDAARAAARTFVDLLDLPHDHATVIGFDETARVAQTLTGDGAALRTALDELFTAVGTRIDRGVWAALGELGGPRGRREADQVIVLLTDGRPHLGSEASLRDAVDLARRLRMAIYAIGLGADVQADLLAAIAGDPRRVFLAPSEADLARIYREVARVIPCR